MAGVVLPGTSSVCRVGARNSSDWVAGDVHVDRSVPRRGHRATGRVALRGVSALCPIMPEGGQVAMLGRCGAALWPQQFRAVASLDCWKAQDRLVLDRLVVEDDRARTSESRLGLGVLVCSGYLPGRLVEGGCGGGGGEHGTEGAIIGGGIGGLTAAVAWPPGPGRGGL